MAATRARAIHHDNGVMVKDEQILAQLTMPERAAVSDAIATLQLAERGLRLLRAGYNSIWLQLRQQYDLPEEFSYDPATGNVTPKGG